MMNRHLLTCAQFIDRADAFALEALDELEQRACARHIIRSAHHNGCQEALAAAQTVIDQLAAGLPTAAPSPGLWNAIEARLGAGSGSSNAEWL
jgi:anti-sigma-K factor RskA